MLSLSLYIGIWPITLSKANISQNLTQLWLGKKNFLEIDEMWGNISADIQNYLQTMSLSHKLYHSVLKLIGLFFSWEPEHSEIQGTFRPGKTNIYLRTCSLSRCSYILIIRSPRIKILLLRYDFLKIISKAGRDHGNIKRLY